MVNKKIVIICTIIALVIVGTIVGIKIKNFKEKEYVNENSENKKNTTVVQNTVENEVQEENTLETNETAENTAEKTEVKGEEELNNGNSENKNNTENQDTSTSNNDDENTDETALGLVKKEWGEDNTVYYTIDDQKDNIYTVSVRSKSTTEQLAEYEVNVKDKSVFIK
jgi:FtsZ-interacting cell division protein ZipA